MESLLEKCDSEKSFVSRLTRILLKIKFIPLIEDKEGLPKFSFFSSPVLASFCLYYVASISAFSLSFLFFRISLSQRKSDEYDSIGLTDYISFLSFNFSIFFFFPLTPIILGCAASKAPKISMSVNLPWPKSGLRVIICEFLAGCGYILSVGPSTLYYVSDAKPDGVIFIIISLCLLILVCLFVCFCISTSQILIFSWMDKTIEKMEPTEIETSISNHVNSCLEEYDTLNKALHFYFFFYFSVLQFSWIFSAYLSVTNLLNMKDEEIIVTLGSVLLSLRSCGMFMVSFCCLCNLLHMVEAAENLRNR